MKRKAPRLLLSPHPCLSVPPYVCLSVRVVFICLGSLLLDLQKADENPSNEFHNLCKCDAADLQLDYAVLLDYYRHTSDLHNIYTHLHTYTIHTYVEASEVREKCWLMLKIHDVSIREVPKSNQIKLIQYFSVEIHLFVCSFFPLLLLLLQLPLPKQNSPDFQFSSMLCTWA